MYKVMTLSSGLQRSEGRVDSYVVTDQPDGWSSEHEWPGAAAFKVSMRHDQSTQRRRAFQYADYLNKTTITPPAIGAWGA